MKAAQANLDLELGSKSVFSHLKSELASERMGGVLQAVTAAQAGFDFGSDLKSIAAQAGFDFGSDLKSIFSNVSTASKLFEANQASIRSLLSKYEPIKITTLETTRAKELLGGLAALSKSQIPGILSESLRPLLGSLSSLSSLSARIAQDFSEVQTSLRALPRLLLEAPIIQTYEASRSIVQLINEETETEVELDEPIEFYIAERGTMVERLKDIDKGFSEAFLGAREAIIHKRPDYVRHASTSLRELLGKLIECLVPDDLLQGWYEGADLPIQKPTRKARLRYLFREVNSSSYSVFVEKDIDCILQTFYALNEGTHSLKRPFTDQQISILMTRVEGHLLMLLMAANY